MKTKDPRGFTLVELLVVITIIGMLMALLVPAVGAARDAARTAQCASNMGQVAKALLVHESRKGELPGRVNELAVDPTQSNIDRNTVSWVAAILPEMERSDIYDAVRAGQVFARDPQTVPRLDLVVCPSDVQVSSSIASLSFVVNSGHWDQPTTDLPPGDYDENGLFFGLAIRGKDRDAWVGVPGPKMRMDAVQDGVATTLMLSENIQAGVPEGFSDRDTQPQSWLLSPTEQGDGFVWVNVPDVEHRRFNEGKDLEPDYGSHLFCRPSSNHADGVNVAFCDGHTMFVRDDIDYVVYWQLMTTRGRNAKVPPNKGPLTDYLLSYPLIDESDFR